MGCLAPSVGHQKVDTEHKQHTCQHSARLRCRIHSAKYRVACRLNKRYPTFSRNNLRDLSEYQTKTRFTFHRKSRWWGIWSHGDVTQIDAQHEEAPTSILSSCVLSCYFLLLSMRASGRELKALRCNRSDWCHELHLELAAMLPAGERRWRCHMLACTR